MPLTLPLPTHCTWPSSSSASSHLPRAACCAGDARRRRASCSPRPRGSGSRAGSLSTAPLPTSGPWSPPCSASRWSSAKYCPSFRLPAQVVIRSRARLDRGSWTYIEWDVGMSAINRSDSEASVPCHGAMEGAVSQQGAVDVVGCVWFDSTDHVSRVDVFESYGEVGLLLEMILHGRERIWIQYWNVITDQAHHCSSSRKGQRNMTAFNSTSH